MASGTAQIFLDIKNRLEAASPAIAYPASFIPSKTGKFVYLWNDTARRLRKGKYAMLQLPAIFIELKKPIEILQYGNGTITQRMTIRIHIAHKFLNANDNIVSFDQDLPIYELKDWVFQMLQMFQPTNCSFMNLTSEEPDSDHDMLVEYLQDYTLQFTNSLNDQPIAGGQMNDNTALDASMTITADPTQ